MAIAFRSGSTGGSGDTGNVTITKPVGAANDDVIFAVLYREGGVWTLPAGWTQVAEVRDRDNVMWVTVVWHRVLNDGADYTFQIAAGAWRTIAMAAFSGVTTGAPVDVFATFNAPTAVDYLVRAASITTTLADTMRIAFHANMNGDNIGAGTSGYTQGPELGGVEIWYSPQAAAGASGVKEFTNTNFTARWASVHLAAIAAGGASPITGTGAINPDPVTIAGIGSVKATGTGAVSPGGVVMAGAGSVKATGTGAVNPGEAVLSGVGSARIAGTGAVSPDPVAIFGVGNAGSLPTISGTGAINPGPVAIAGAGAPRVVGTGDASPDGVVFSGAGGARVTGFGILDPDAVQIIATGSVRVFGFGALAPEAVVISGAGRVIVPNVEARAAQSWLARRFVAALLTRRPAALRMAEYRLARVNLAVAGGAIMGEWYVGDAPEVTALFTGVDGAPVDPSVVRVSIKTPSGQITTLEYDGINPAITRDSIGFYRFTLSLTQSGQWYYRAWSPGTHKAASEGALYVERSNF